MAIVPILDTVPSENIEKFEELLIQRGSKFACVGKVIEDKILRIKGLGKKTIVDIPLTELKSAWKSTHGGLV